MIQPRPENYPKKPEQQKVPTVIFRGNSFTLSFPDGWQDKTIYTLTGPVEDGIQHSVLITLEQNVAFDSVREYAEWQIGALEQELKGCRLLKKGNISLANGLPAYQAIFSWYPTETLRVYQEQIFVLADATAYKLTATFTKKTRKTLGQQVERMMLSFTPVKRPVESADQKVQRR